MRIQPLAVDALYRSCDPNDVPFETTDEVTPLTDIVGQPRAAEALRFGMDIGRQGYNVFALGAPGTGKRTFVHQFLRERGAQERTPDDWCYVNNFEQPHRPIGLRLPPGRGRQLRQAMEGLVRNVRHVLCGVFESEEYRRQRDAIEQETSKQQEQAFEELRERAREKRLALIPTPVGLATVPADEGGTPMSREHVAQLPARQRERYQATAREFQKQIEGMFAGGARMQRELQDRLDRFDRHTAQQAIRPLMDECRRPHGNLPAVLEYLDAVEQDVVQHAPYLLKLETSEAAAQRGKPRASGGRVAGDEEDAVSGPALLRRYRVNVLTEHERAGGAPVIYEDNPTYQRLIGHIDHLAQMGTLVTDFNLVKPGALHRANGGYLMLEPHRLLMYPQAWEALKRALRREQIQIESLGEALGLISTMQLEPEPIPLEVKVVLLGDPLVYYLLRELDPDFAELFKVPADFDDRLARGREEQQLYARLIATLVQKQELMAFDRSAVARVVEHGARLAEDAQKLSTCMRPIADLLREADYCAHRNGHTTVMADDVQHAIDAQIYRSDRMRERLHEAVARCMLRVDTKGSVTGQINALAVMPAGDLTFGQPARVTARVGVGSGEVLDIEREVALGGALHTKGVLTLVGFLNGRFATDQPLSLSASLVLEQSAYGVSGDSASAAELCALLSALAKLPIKQSLAITGSVDQLGRVQAIGAANEKIEGFADICSATGLTGEQGVLIPRSNVQHLMLRADVVKLVADGRFQVWPIETIDDAMELLTGVPAGEAGENGTYPEETVNGRVRRRLIQFAEQRERFGGNGRTSRPR